MSIFMAMNPPSEPQLEPVKEAEVPEITEQIPVPEEQITEQKNEVDSPVEGEQVVVETPDTPAEKPYASHYFSSRRERNVFLFVASPIFVISCVSTLHLILFFGVGNTVLESYLLAGAFELSSIAIMVALVTLKSLSKFALWSILILLYSLQMLGNVYACFDRIIPSISQNFFLFIGLDPASVADRRIAALVLGGIITTTSLFFTKILTKQLATKE